MTNYTNRVLPAASFKFAGNGSQIEGYASVFGERDLVGDVVAAGAYGKSLGALKSAGRPLPMLWAHSQEDVIGSWSEMNEDAVGLYVRGAINTDVEKGREALALVRKGDLSGLSIGYVVPEGGATRVGGTVYLTEIKLLEVSVVAVPAAENARIVLKDFSDLGKFADFLQGVGVSRREAEFVARKAWPGLSSTPETDYSTVVELVKQSMGEMKKLKDMFR